MYIRKGPVFYTNGERTIKVHYTAHARDLESIGWIDVKKIKLPPETVSTEVTEVKEEPKIIEEVKELVTEGNSNSSTLNVKEISGENKFSDFTKAELISYAEVLGLEIKSWMTKAEIIQEIEKEEHD